MKKTDRAELRTWVEIDRRAIRANYRALRKLIPNGVRIAGVVKSNASGHDLILFSVELEKCGIEMLAVDSLVEALALRKAKIHLPILVIGYTLPEMYAKAANKNIHLTISSTEALRTLLKNPKTKKIPVHIKVDTGMHRQGFSFSELDKVLFLIKNSGISVAGLYTHFASAKNPNEREFTLKQVREFNAWREAFTHAGFSFLTHAGATGGALFFPEAHFDMVRVGAGLYGFWTPQETELMLRKNFSLKPALSWKTIISEVKEIPAGSGVGYDLTYKTKRTTRVAVCPIGYWHGYPRSLSDRSDVLVHGKRARVLGRVSMDMIVIDVTDIPRAKIEDEVVLVGRFGDEEITANELAQHAGTTAYEILTRLNPLMKRIYR